MTINFACTKRRVYSEVCKLWHSVSWEKQILKCLTLLSLSRPVSEKVIHLNKFESISPKKLRAKFGWNWSSCFREDENVKKVYIDDCNDRQQINFFIRKAHSSEFKMKWKWTCTVVMDDEVSWQISPDMCSAERVLASACKICIAGIGNFGECSRELALLNTPQILTK